MVNENMECCDDPDNQPAAGEMIDVIVRKVHCRRLYIGPRAGSIGQNVALLCQGKFNRNDECFRCVVFLRQRLKFARASYHLDCRFIEFRMTR